MAPFSSFLGDGLPKYKYKPIPPGTRTFRLAKLLPPEPSLIPGLEPTLLISILECEAGVGDRSGASQTAASVEYDALSYAWDVPPNAKHPNRRIIVEDGGERSYLYVYRPLELALLRFAAANVHDRWPKYELPIFIDQICINQEDEDEKAQQVLLMQAIYTHSHRAVIWLGPGTASSDTWFAYARALCADGILANVLHLPADSIVRLYDSVVSTEPLAITLTDTVEIQTRDELLSLTERFAYQYPIQEYLALLRRTWFSRLWTIQEACLAPAVVLVCGDALLCLDCFRSVAFFYNVQNNYWLHRITGPVSQKEMIQRDAVFTSVEGFTRIYRERKAIHERGRYAPLHELVIKYSVEVDGRRKAGASLAQDRVYGLLGLTAADDPVKTQLGIYYDKTNQSVAHVKAYTEAMGLFLEQGHMDVLLFNQFPKKTPGLPSWVPDWAMELVLPLAWPALLEPVFAAGGPQEASFAKADVPAGKISIKGVLIGRVSVIGQVTYKSNSKPYLLETVRYDDAKLVFDEVDRFVRSALTQDTTAAPSAETVMHTCLRVYDSGLSARNFTSESGCATAGMQRLATVQSAISQLGERLLRSASIVRSYSLFNIYATVGITPWYVDYYRATTVLHHLARGPVRLARTVLLALADLVEDVVGLCVASARVWLATKWIALRRRADKVQLRMSDAQYRSTGLDPDITQSKDMSAFLNNLLRNVERRVFRTEEGPHVGMGPGGMQVGDAVVVLKGLTMPLVLRCGEGAGEEEWTVVGEAYCDGFMDGEALGVNEREFVLV
ncbi:hypothetical protein V2A60_000469 [Cordyceps javanica]